MPPDSDGGRNVSCRLSKITRSTDTLNTLESFVQRVHQVVIHATECISLLVHEDAEAGRSFAELINLNDHGSVNTMFSAITDAKGSSEEKHPHLFALRKRTRDTLRRIQSSEETCELLASKGIAQLLKQEARFYISSLKTGLKMHFISRVERFVKLKLREEWELSHPEEQPEKLSKEERTRHRVRITTIRNDVCRPGYRPVESSGNDALLVSSMRSILQLDKMEWEKTTANGRVLGKTLFDLIKANPHHFLPGMVALNKCFHAAGERTFRVVPMRTSPTPCFITIDQDALKEMGLLDEEARLEIGRRVRSRCEKKAPYEKRLKVIRKKYTDIRSEVKQVNLAADEQSRENARVEAEKFDQNLAVEGGSKKRKPPKWSLSKQEREKRNQWDEQNRKQEIEELDTIRDDPVYKNLLDSALAEKRETFEAVFDLSTALSKKDAKDWKFSLKTDGVSARLLMCRKGEPLEPTEDPMPSSPSENTSDIDEVIPVEKKPRHSTDKPPSAPPPPLPRNGVLTVEQLRTSLFGSEDVPVHTVDSLSVSSLGALHQNPVLNDAIQQCSIRDLPPIVWLGDDPGNHELAVISNPDFLWHRHKDRKAHVQAGGITVPHTVRYTARQRRNDTTPARFFIKKKHAQDAERKSKSDSARQYRHEHLVPPVEVVEADRQLSSENSKGPTSEALLGYLRKRSALRSTLTPWYTDPTRRHVRWKAFIEKQRSFSQLCDRIRQMAIQQRGKNAKVVIAYGAYGSTSGLVVKGMAPTINVGLMRMLAREFVVVVVPEHYTSKRCMHCKGECGNHAYLADRDRCAQRDERLDERLQKQLANADLTPQQKAKAVKSYHRSMAFPCEIRGLRFCQQCHRCLNRDANAAPQMAVQLKRLVLGLGVLYPRTKQEAAMDAMDDTVGT